LLFGNELKFLDNSGERVAAQLDAQRRLIGRPCYDDRTGRLDRVAGLVVVDVGGVLPGGTSGFGVVLDDGALGAQA